MATYGEMYRDYLDELYDVEPYYWSACLEAVDPTAFAVGFGEYAANFDIFECSECSKLLEDDASDDVEMRDRPICRRCADICGMSTDEIAAYDKGRLVEA